MDIRVTVLEPGKFLKPESKYFMFSADILTEIVQPKPKRRTSKRAASLICFEKL